MLSTQLKNIVTELSSTNDIQVDAAQQQQLVEFVQLLAKWNKAYNLTSVRDPEQMMIRHVADSLVVLPYLHGNTLADVGTGPGLPGLPLAICQPQRQFYLIDSLGKRITFIRQVIHQLGLTNVTAVQARVEDFQLPEGADSIISRAFASLADMVTWCHHLLSENGRFLALKGQLDSAELAALPAPYQVHGSHRLVVPNLDAERHLVDIRR